MAERREIILKITAESGEAQKRLAEINRELVEQEKRLADLKKAKKAGLITDEEFIAKTREVKQATSELRKEARQITRQLELQKRATDAAEGSNEQLKAQLSLLTAAYNKLSREERENTQAGRDLKRATRELSDEIKRNERAVGDNRREVGNYENALRGTTGRILGAAGLVFGMTTLGDVAGKVASVFVDFTDKVATLQAISGATDEELVSLTDEARRLGETTQFTASQVVELQTNFARIGFDPSQILAATEATSNLAIATGEDLATAAEVAGFTLGGYGLTAQDTARVTDVMAASFNASALNLERFSEATKFVAPVAKAANVSIETTTAALGALADSGLTGSVAGTGLRKVLLDLADANSDLSKATGFAVTDSESFIEALKVLRDSGIDATRAAELVDLTAVPAFLNLTANADRVEELAESLYNAAGAAEETAKVVANSLKGDVLAAQSAMEALAITAGTELEGAMRQVVQSFTVFTRSLQALPEFVRENKVELQALGAALIALNINNITAAASAIRKAAADRIATISTQVLKIETLSLNAAMRANPIGLVISLLAALVIGIVQAYKNSETFRNFVDRLWTTLKSGGLAVWDTLRPVFEGISFWFGRLVAAAQTAAQMMAPAFEVIGRVAGKVFGFLGRAISKYARFQAEQFGNLVEGLGSLRAQFSGAGAAIVSIVNQLASAIREQWGGLADLIAGIISLDTARIEAGWQRLKSGIKATFADIGRTASVAYTDAVAEAEAPGVWGKALANFRENYTARLADESRQATIDAMTELPPVVGEEAEAAGKVIASSLGEGMATELGQGPTGEKVAAAVVEAIRQPSFDVPSMDDIGEQEAAPAAEIERAKQNAITREQDAAANERLMAKLREVADNERLEQESAERIAALNKLQTQQRMEGLQALGLAFSQLGDVVKEESIASKALAVGEATVATYLAATKALASAPAPFNFILMGTTIAAGLANVSKILGVNFATGGKVGPGNIPAQPNGDNVLATVRTGEVVLTERHQQALGGAETFRRIGVPGFAQGGLVGSTIVASQSNSALAASQTSELVQALMSMPPPVVTVRDIETARRKVEVRDQINRF